MHHRKRKVIRKQKSDKDRNMAASLEDLPDVVLIQIFGYLKTEELMVLSEVSQRLDSIVCDRKFVRVANFEGAYTLTDVRLKKFVNSHCDKIEQLTFNHCFWIPQKVIQSAVVKCKSLKELHVIECKLRNDQLVCMVARCLNLKALSFSITTFADIKKDVFSPAQETLRSLSRIHVFYTSTGLTLMNYLGENATILDHCHNLEDITISSAGMAVPELYRPIITKPKSHMKIKAMSITSNIHAGAQMFFYGTLSQLPNAHLRWRTLLMPNVNFSEFIRKSEFRDCFQHIEDLQHLDVSGSKVTFPNEAMKLERAQKLQHMNLRMTIVNSDQLKYIATNCSRLHSVNLFGCSSILISRNNKFDTQGLECLFAWCPNLKHLNIAGEHHHATPLCGGRAIQHLGESIRGLTSLAIPTCMLYQTDGQPPRAAKRIMSTSHNDRFAPSCKRFAPSVPYLAYPESMSTSSPRRAPCREPQPSTSSGLSSSTPAYDSNTREPLMQKLVKSNPDLTELEVIAVKFESAFHRNKFVNPKTQEFKPCNETRLVRDPDLEAISKLKRLKKLTLAGVPGLLSGRCLITIATECQNLESLSLANFAQNPMTVSYALCEALKVCLNLKDIRLEQSHLPLNDSLFESISHCKQLQRLCILAKHSNYENRDIVKMVDELQKLVVLQVFGCTTLTKRRVLAQTLNKRHVKTRPTFSYTFRSLLYDGISQAIASIPAKHIEELTRFDTRVCLVP